MMNGSRLERRKDRQLSMKQRTLAAMVGQLTMIAAFPDHGLMVLATRPVTERAKGTRRSISRAVVG